eukprot:CAMPEP_0205805528 /NCGR_PEP_ID=MMETSP0205-20121125/8782_1 /ASSEMBLY_ACC=CAM_ASM_000278 /TAXON_ID=36767 /ORGANISM="Euplotes focardii, Strain TN1" /LENGTH=150 /DNA_ID=CAMNT_0053076897 /DNA_START=299 /DNA_END=751 /DNA_ORIENTATION=-
MEDEDKEIEKFKKEQDAINNSQEFSGYMEKEKAKIFAPRDKAQTVSIKIENFSKISKNNLRGNEIEQPQKINLKLKDIEEETKQIIEDEKEENSYLKIDNGNEENKNENQKRIKGNSMFDQKPPISLKGMTQPAVKVAVKNKLTRKMKTQ